jgi:hypothetical protein
MKIVGGQMIGWTGNQTSKPAPEVLEDVLTAPDPEDMLVEFRVNYRENNGSNKINKIKAWHWSISGHVEVETLIYPFWTMSLTKDSNIFENISNNFHAN